MVRLAMIGCGQISERFFRQAAARDDTRFVATCARRMDSAARKAREHGIPDAYDDYERMLDETRPDGVVITTPHSVHAAPALAAFARGIHVLCEKPMATSWEDCRAMVEAADRAGARFMCLPFDHTPAFLTALRTLNETHLGRFTGAEAVLLIPGPPRDNWYYDRSIAHGGAMLDCLVYPVSRLVSLLGPARRVTGFVNTLIPRRIVADGRRVDSDVDDNVSLLVEWPNGQQAVARTLWGTSFVRNDTTVFGRRGTLWLSGDRVVLHAPDEALRAALPGDAQPIEWNGFSDCFRIPLPDVGRAESLIDHFVTCIRSGSEPKCSGRLQLHVHEILFKGYLAAETGRTQELETTFTPWHEIAPRFHETRDGYL